MFRNNIAGNNRIASRCPRRSRLPGLPVLWQTGGGQVGFAVSIGTIVTALIVAPSACLWQAGVAFAQSPLTNQPSTGRVGIGNTNAL